MTIQATNYITHSKGEMKLEQKPQLFTYPALEKLKEIRFNLGPGYYNAVLEESIYHYGYAITVTLPELEDVLEYVRATYLPEKESYNKKYKANIRYGHRKEVARKMALRFCEWSSNPQKVKEYDQRLKEKALLRLKQENDLAKLAAEIEKNRPEAQDLTTMPIETLKDFADKLKKERETNWRERYPSLSLSYDPATQTEQVLPELADTKTP